MLVINQAWDLDGLYADGIMGMSPTSQYSDADLVIEELYTQGVIDEKAFSIQVGDGDEPSRITIGGYDSEKYAKENITWHALANELYWTINMDNVSLGNETLDIDTRNVIVDSGTSYLLMPTTDFSEFTKYFKERSNCWVDSYYYGLYICECKDELEFEQYPNLDFSIDGKTYTMTKENYVERQAGMCIFKIMSMDFSYQEPFWIMGLTFFHNYYTVFDQGHSRIGFAESKLSNLRPKFDVLALPTVQQSLAGLERQGSSSGAWIIVAIAMVAVLIAGMRIVKKKQLKADSKPDVSTREVLLSNAVHEC